MRVVFKCVEKGVIVLESFQRNETEFSVSDYFK